MKLKSLLLLSSFSLLTACAVIGAEDNSVIKMLSNRGPVSLSDENPYIASNVLLAREMEASTTLRGFIDHAGKPDAIQIEKGMFRPTVMYFYYSKRQEAYILRRNKDLTNEWLIVGPTGIPQELASRIRPANQSPPLIQSRAKLADPVEAPTAKKQIIEENELLEQLENYSPPPKQAPKPQDNSYANKVPQQRYLDAPSGDIIHKVTYTGETLRLIAEWYTGDVKNAGRLSKINSLNDANMLHLNQTIRIPRYLINNRQALTLDAVDKYYAKLYPPSPQ